MSSKLLAKYLCDTSRQFVQVKLEASVQRILLVRWHVKVIYPLWVLLVQWLIFILHMAICLCSLIQPLKVEMSQQESTMIHVEKLHDIIQFKQLLTIHIKDIITLGESSRTQFQVLLNTEQTIICHSQPFRYRQWSPLLRDYQISVKLQLQDYNS